MTSHTIYWEAMNAGRDGVRVQLAKMLEDTWTPKWIVKACEDMECLL